MAVESKNGTAETIKQLCRRDIQLALLVGLEGLTCEEIGIRLSLSTETVRSYMARLRSRLGIHRKAQVAVWATTNRGKLKSRLKMIQEGKYERQRQWVGVDF